MDRPAQSALLPRRLFFDPSEKQLVRISPDGRWIAFQAPIDDILNLWLAPVEEPEKARPLTHVSDRNIGPAVVWAYDNRHILIIRDKAGDENWCVWSIDIKTGQERALTPRSGVQAYIQQISRHFCCFDRTRWEVLDPDYQRDFDALAGLFPGDITFTSMSDDRRKIIVAHLQDTRPLAYFCYSDQIVAAMQERGIPVTYILYPDEGHGVERTENRRSYTAVVEAFLATHLGGHCEPVGDDFAGSSIAFKTGSELITGL